MMSLVYMSIARDDLTDEQLGDLLRDARFKNQTLGVSGLLVAKEGRFMQVLEGPEMSVEDRFAAIERDVRHHDVRTLSREQITERRFEDWSMAFAAPSDDDVRTEEGFNPFLERRSGLPKALSGSSADWLLRWFRGRKLVEVDEQITLGRTAA